MQSVIGVTNRNLRAPRFSDVVIFSITLLLVGFSIVMVYSTTGVISSEKFGDPLFYVKRQIAASIVGVALLLVCSRINVEMLKKISVMALPIFIVLLIMPLLPGLGDSAGGARRWVNLFGLRFQPGEFAKVLFIVFLAGYLSRHETRLSTFKQGIVKPFGIMCITAALLLMQPDFGSTAVICLIALCMIGATGVRLRYLAFFAGFIALCMATLVVISPYRMKRIVSFLYPWADASGKGYQLIQSLIAVGTGQTAGVGLGSSQQKLFFLPAAHTDFIFAVIGEELGFIGCSAVIAFFLIFLWRGLRIAGRFADDTFSFSLALGLTLLIVIPALLNVGVVTGLLPTKGMVLPLIGYGGSSLVACMMAVGVLLALARSLHKRV